MLLFVLTWCRDEDPVIYVPYAVEFDNKYAQLRDWICHTTTSLLPSWAIRYQIRVSHTVKHHSRILITAVYLRCCTVKYKWHRMHVVAREIPETWDDFISHLVKWNVKPEVRTEASFSYLLILPIAFMVLGLLKSFMTILFFLCF